MDTTQTVTPTKQQPIPGTEAKVSKKLRGLVEERALNLYRAKACMARVRELNEEIVPLFEDERVDAVSCEVEVGDETRRCITRLERKSKLKSELEKQDDDE